VLEEFRRSTQALLERNGLTPADIADVVGGISGADTAVQERLLEGLLQRLGFAQALVCNDGYLPVKAECAGGVGVAYNCGTGVCCTAIDDAGRMTKIGGLDEWSKDMGGGVWLLQQIFGAVYDDAALGIGKTTLTDKYARVMGEKTADFPGTLDESLMRLKEDADAQHRLIAAMFEALDEGDAAAQEIASMMIGRAADYIAAACRRSAFGDGPVQVVLCGSILLKAASETYLDRFRAAAEQRAGRPLCFLTPKNTAAHGAAQWLRERAEK